MTLKETITDILSLYEIVVKEEPFDITDGVIRLNKISNRDALIDEIIDEIEEYEEENDSDVVDTYCVVGTEENYTVSELSDGSFTCTCKIFTERRKVCHHIGSVQALEDKDSEMPRPDIIKAGVSIMPFYSKENNLIFVPNIQYPTEFTRYKIAYVMLQHGYSIAEIKRAYSLNENSSSLFNKIMEHNGNSIRCHDDFTKKPISRLKPVDK